MHSQVVFKPVFPFIYGLKCHVNRAVIKGAIVHIPHLYAFRIFVKSHVQAVHLVFWVVSSDG